METTNQTIAQNEEIIPAEQDAADTSTARDDEAVVDPNLLIILAKHFSASTVQLLKRAHDDYGESQRRRIDAQAEYDRLYDEEHEARKRLAGAIHVAMVEVLGEPAVRLYRQQAIYRDELESI